MGMEHAFAELPLALFSTLAPMGAGAFVFLAIAFFAKSFDADVLKKIDRLTVIPLAFVIVGFICAFFHLANPLNAINVFARVGGSPMSNEILMGVVFCVVAIVYWIIALTTSMSEGLRKCLSVIVAIVGLVFCIFVGLAYGMPTIPSWDNFAVPLSTLFFGVMGGAAVTAIVLRCAGAIGDASGELAKPYVVVTWIGVIGSAVFFAVNMSIVAGLQNGMMIGGDVVMGIIVWIIIAIVLMVASGVLVMRELKVTRPVAYAWVVAFVTCLAIFLARLAFYACEMSIGIGI